MRPYLTLHNPSAAKHYYETGLWTGDTFYSLLANNASIRPDALALRDGRAHLTWSEVLARVDGIAAKLRDCGLQGGDRVSIWMSNKLESILMFLACAREGFACNPSLHRTHTCAEVGALLDSLSARVLLVEAGWGADRHEANFDEILSQVKSLKVVFTPESLPGPATNLTPPNTDPDCVTYLAFTSGTTGKPKCVMHSHNTLLANAREMVRDWRHSTETSIMTLAPLSHHIAWVATAQWLIAGGSLITCDPPAGMLPLDWIIETGVNYVMGVPTHAMDVLQVQKERGLERLGNVDVFYMAGSPIPPSVASAFLDQGIKAQNVYGMTENSSHQYTHTDDEFTTIVNTCGRGGSAYEVRIFDQADQDTPIGIGRTGQIGGRGAALMLGYFDNQIATESSFNKDGWFMSGDLGSLDERSNLRIEGRIKDLIIRGGHNIYPSHIEAIAIRHSGVERAACFPIADQRLGERVCLAIVGDADAEDLLSHLAAEGLSKYDMPEFFVRVSALPLTASGKILKRELIEQVRRNEIRPVPIRYMVDRK